jgi:hypothetical protein
MYLDLTEHPAVPAQGELRFRPAFAAALELHPNLGRPGSLHVMVDLASMEAWA